MGIAKAHTWCSRHKGVWLFCFLRHLEDFLMVGKPTYEELEQRVKELEKESAAQAEGGGVRKSNG